MPNQACPGDEGEQRTNEMAFNPVGNDEMDASFLDEVSQTNNSGNQPPREKG